MPAAKRTRREPTDDWQQLQKLTRFPEQLTDELIRPVVRFGHSPAERARCTGAPERTLYRQVARFEASGMARLFDAIPMTQPRLRPEIRQAILELKAEHSGSAHLRDHHHFAAVVELERLETPDQSPQPPLWNRTADDWLTVIKVAPYAPRRPGNDDDALQPHLFPEDMIDEAS
jgi:hypothetical protein